MRFMIHSNLEKQNRSPYTIQGSVIDYIDSLFLHPMYKETTEYEKGTILNTKVRYRTNATILEVIPEENLYKILTDIGNVLYVTKETLQKDYLEPIQKRV